MSSLNTELIMRLICMSIKLARLIHSNVICMGPSASGLGCLQEQISRTNFLKPSPGTKLLGPAFQASLFEILNPQAQDPTLQNRDPKP